MVAMLVDHVAQHAPRLLAILLAAHAAAAPGNLFPHHDAELVAACSSASREPLIVPQADEIAAHLLDHPHLLADQVFGHGRRQPGVVLVPLRAAQEQPLTVELERAVLRETRNNAGRSALHLLLAVRALHHAQRYSLRLRRRPQRRASTANAASSCSPVHAASDFDDVCITLPAASSHARLDLHRSFSPAGLYRRAFTIPPPCPAPSCCPHALAPR